MCLIVLVSAHTCVHYASVLTSVRVCTVFVCVGECGCIHCVYALGNLHVCALCVCVVVCATCCLRAGSDLVMPEFILSESREHEETLP